MKIYSGFYALSIDRYDFSIKYRTINENSLKIFDSIIKFDHNLVKSWLNNRNFKSELLFRKSRDGSTPKDFHN